MIGRMKYRLLRWGTAVLSLLWTPLLVLAQDEKEPYDARVEGYEGNLTLDAGGTGVTWLLLIVLGVLCLGVLFKSAGRSHLD
jgi:hypothetical protein